MTLEKCCRAFGVSFAFYAFDRRLSVYPDIADVCVCVCVCVCVGAVSIGQIWIAKTLLQ
jgi:hypothetical protein